MVTIFGWSDYCPQRFPRLVEDSCGRYVEYDSYEELEEAYLTMAKQMEEAGKLMYEASELIKKYEKMFDKLKVDFLKD